MNGHRARIASALLVCTASASLVHCKRGGRAEPSTQSDAAPEASPQSSAPSTVAGSPPAQRSACDTPIYEAPSGSTIENLTQTSTTLLWREPSGVMGYRKPDGPARLIVPLDRPQQLAADDTYAYVALEGREQRGLFRVPFAGGAPEFMAAAAGVFNTIDALFDGQSIYARVSDNNNRH
jgi:hypothetical protein